MKFWGYFFLFLLINFGGLALGGWLMNNGPSSTWYAELNKAPWTPPGWVFGAAWTTIMICFSFYLAKLFVLSSSIHFWLLYGLQVILNISWNYIFFNQHLIFAGLLFICALTALLFYYFLTFKKGMKITRYLLTPYILWLLIATSLNFYIFIYN